MDKKIPSNTILMLSGVACVGKTTTARNIVKNYEEFKLVTEVDIIREVIRYTIKNVDAYYKFYDKNSVTLEYKSLFDSLTDGDYNTLLNQAKALLPYIRSIVYKQQRKNIATIIEGMCIVPELYFKNYVPIDGFKNNVVFINLYISNQKKHFSRGDRRCKERNYDTNKNMYDKIIKMESKNIALHESTLKLSEHCKNVYSIDVTNLNKIDIVDIIMKLLFKLFI